MKSAHIKFKSRHSPRIWNFKFYVKFKIMNYKVFRHGRYKAKVNLKFNGGGPKAQSKLEALAKFYKANKFKRAISQTGKF